ncbi:MAG: PaaI family thioesterase [Sneathiellaceae bacterium]
MASDPPRDPSPSTPPPSAPPPSAPSGGPLKAAGLDLKTMEKMIRLGIPHCAALGVTVEAVSAGRVTFGLPYDRRFVGDPERGILHGGVVTTLIDTVCGMAVMARLMRLLPIATLDLRIDYLAPARADETLYASAECYHTTRSIAFCRAWAWHQGAEDDPVATCAGTFMLNSVGKPPVRRDIEAEVRAATGQDAAPGGDPA